MRGNQSEVARLREQIALEYEAAQLALHGPVTVGRHAFLIARTENLGKPVETLADEVGIEQSVVIFAEVLEKVSDTWAREEKNCSAHPGNEVQRCEVGYVV